MVENEKVYNNFPGGTVGNDFQGPPPNKCYNTSYKHSAF